MSFSYTRRLVLAVLLLGAWTWGLPTPQSKPQPFTLDSLLLECRFIHSLGEEEVAAHVEDRGVDFKLTEGATRRLRHEGAGDKLIAAVQKASDQYMKTARSEPAVGSPAAIAPPPAQEVVMPPLLDERGQQALLERAREQAVDFTRGLPSYLCSQVTKRYQWPKSRDTRSLMDTILTKVSYDGEKHQEKYEVVTVNNAPTSKTMEQLGGSISTGEFASMLLAVFDPERMARFQWLRQGALRGHAVEVYGYNVDKEHAQWRLEFDRRVSTFPAYRGQAFIDRETAQVLRLSMTAVDIDRDFPIRNAESTLDYDWAQISGIAFLLPARSVMLLSDGQMMSQNEIDFRAYRKFDTSSTISFGDDADDKKDDKKDKKPDDKTPPPVKKP